MMNLVKTKKEKCQLPHPSFKKACPCTVLPSAFFFIFQILPFRGGNQYFLPLSFKKKVRLGGVGGEVGEIRTMAILMKLTTDFNKVFHLAKSWDVIQKVYEDINKKTHKMSQKDFLA